MSINTFFLRVAASCNLDCDYCYVFKHRDLSWKYMPAVISDNTVYAFSSRLKEYCVNKNINEVNIIFHGGEPLVCSSEKLLQYADNISTDLKSIAKANFSMQTNGTLVTEDFLKKCVKKNIGISVSIDGHEKIHDSHRHYKNGKGSHKDVVKALKLLKKYPSVFEGVIGVIDPNFDPDEILSFFDELGIENVDLLLPDSTYQDLPKGRDSNPTIYKDWLIKAFDSWFFKHQSIKLRTFEHLLSGIIGESNTLDSFGLGTLDYLTIETDGTYHTTDILKVAFENASSIGMNVFENSINDALNSEKVCQYNEMLSATSLPGKCIKCKYSSLCGAGSLPHRYSLENGFNNPTIYCNENYYLIEHIITVLQEALEKENA